MKSTPGPWNFETPNHPKTIHAGNILIAEVFANSKTNEETEANARLVASSPELLDALRQYVLDDECSIDGAPDANNLNHDCRWCRAMRAILKAQSGSECKGE